MLNSDTIVAPATVVGDGGIGIIRLSGPKAEPLLCRFFRAVRQPPPPFTSHRLYYGHLLDAQDEIVDEVLAVVMRSPRSYTREDVVEIHAHGGPVVIRKILDLLINAGARLARPGEFTLRAFLNGRIDLAQAEAVIDVIRSRSDAAQRLAQRQMAGRLSEAVFSLRNDLVDVLAEIEAYIDFPEEDLGEASSCRLAAVVAAISDRIGRLLDTFDSGRLLHEGLQIVILGKPNVGKSSLLNALLGEARAIVTEIPGTTRDTIEETLQLAGLPVRLIDTAGIRSTDDPVEAEGVRRATEKTLGADLILLVLDAHAPLTAEDFQALELCRERRMLLVLNKADLPSQPLPPTLASLPSVAVSARTGQDLDRLFTAIRDLCGLTLESDGLPSVQVYLRRHRQALLLARASIDRFLAEVENGTAPEFLAVELREALTALGEITGETTPEDVLDRIFSRFCIGK